MTNLIDPGQYEHHHSAYLQLSPDIIKRAANHVEDCSDDLETFFRGYIFWNYINFSIVYEKL